MIECETKLKSWGNSFGIVIPKKKVKDENLLPNEKVRVIVSQIKQLKVKDIFGKLKLKKHVSKLMTEIKKDLDSKLF